MPARTRVSRLLVIFGALLAFSGMLCHGEETIDRNRIEPCPPSPNCVSSRSSDLARYVAPWQVRVASDKAWEGLKAALVAEQRATIVEDARVDGYLRAEVVSLVFGFVDDVEFQILPEDHLIHVRSASRVGYWDIGVNRRRVDRIASRLREAGLVK